MSMVFSPRDKTCHCAMALLYEPDRSPATTDHSRLKLQQTRFLPHRRWDLAYSSCASIGSVIFLPGVLSKQCPAPFTHIEVFMLRSASHLHMICLYSGVYIAFHMTSRCRRSLTRKRPQVILSIGYILVRVYTCRPMEYERTISNSKVQGRTQEFWRGTLHANAEDAEK